MFESFRDVNVFKIRYVHADTADVQPPSVSLLFSALLTAPGSCLIRQIRSPGFHGQRRCLLVVVLHGVTPTMVIERAALLRLQSSSWSS